MASRSPCGSRSTSTRTRAGSGLDAIPAGLPLTEGRACLTAHSHAQDFTWQQNFQVRGDLVEILGDWALVPRKLVGGFELPKGLGRYKRLPHEALALLQDRESANFQLTRRWRRRSRAHGGTLGVVGEGLQPGVPRAGLVRVLALTPPSRCAAA